jgi:general secretion pathway protein G
MCMQAPKLSHPARLAARAQRGMTLIEIMIVIAIIGIIVAVVAVNVVGSSEEAKVKLCYTEMKKIEGAYAKWSADSDQPCPASIDELKRDMGKRQADTVKDPWGGEYVMLCADQAPPECEGFCVRSNGKDHKEGTDDDVKSWIKPTTK